MKTNKVLAVPKLRFPEFRDNEGWRIGKVQDLGHVVTGNTPRTADRRNYGGNKLFVSPADMSETRYITSTKTKITIEGWKQVRPISVGSTLFVCIGSTIGKVSQTKVECATNQQINAVIPYDEYVNDFVYSLLEKYSTSISEIAGNHAVPIINKSLFSSARIYIPKLLEQKKIADCLSSLDYLIDAESEQLEALKSHKAGLLQQLFPADGETVPKLRFTEFEDDGDWEDKQIKELLGYEQPTKYLVSNTDYISEGIPVLTANKSFVLGYTNEKNGVYKNIPVIIFDDFTTDNKYVDFPFKVKSSAIKILTSKDNSDIRFLYALFNNIKFDASQHKRYYISTYQNITVKVPSFKEQQKIADCLSSLDKLIQLSIDKIKALKRHKQGLMQQLFPSSENPS